MNPFWVALRFAGLYYDPEDDGGDPSYAEENPLKLGVVQLADGQGKCLVCLKSFCNLYKAKRHYREVHCGGAVMEKCSVCGAEFKNRRYRDTHMKRRHGISKKMLDEMIIPE
jgi:hypothetical protein